MPTPPAAPAVTHQTAGSNKLAILCNRGHRLTEGKPGEKPAARREKWIVADYEASDPQFGEFRESIRNTLLGAGLQNMNLQSPVFGGGPNIIPNGFSVRGCGVG